MSNPDELAAIQGEDPEATRRQEEAEFRQSLLRVLSSLDARIQKLEERP